MDSFDRRRFVKTAVFAPWLTEWAPAHAGLKPNEMLIYCGITMVRPMTEIARRFEQQEGGGLSIRIAQGGSEDLYASLKSARVGDLYLPGEPSYRSKYLHEGFLEDHLVVGYNQLALMVAKGNPRKIKPSSNELTRGDLIVAIGNADSGSVGLESKDVLDSVGLYTQVLKNAALLAPDSRSLINALKEREVDLVLNWRATAFFPENRPKIDVLDLDPRLAKPAPLLLNQLSFSTNKPRARRLIDYAAGPKGQAVFEHWGFTLAKGAR